MGDASPERQAYSEVGTEGYKGRFVANISNIRLFKSNPYIMNLSESEKETLNADLLTPYQGEMFYDDDYNIYVVKVGKDPITGVTTYTYISKTKDTNSKLNYYESKGVLNQLISAYNNGQVYKFYYNVGTKTMYPNSSLVFPSNYNSYTVRKQELNDEAKYVYLAGNIVDGNLMDVHIAMKTVIDSVNNTSYTRMGAAKIFDNASPDSQWDIIQNGQFYVVDFFDVNGELIDTKLFQAVQAVTTSVQTPSATVERLGITVFKNGIEANVSNGVYGIYAGEDLSKTTSFAIVAYYSDGTNKLITDKLDTGYLSRDGWDVNTSGAAVGDQFPVTFTYYPNIDENGVPIGQKIPETIIFQVMENTYTNLYKVIPVMWSDNASDLNVVNGSAAVYKLKVYAMSQDGLLTNVTRMFYNTKKKVDGVDLVDFEDCPVTYDPYQQCCIFTFTSNLAGQRTTFEFTLRSNGQEKNLRFAADFGANDADSQYIYVSANGSDGTDYGYGTDGLLSTLASTYGTKEGTIFNKITYNKLASELFMEMFNNTTNVREVYKRRINGVDVYPTKMQIYAVKDATITPLTALTQIPNAVNTVTAYPYKESAVNAILQNGVSNDFMLVKFITELNGDQNLINFDVFRLKVLNQ